MKPVPICGDAERPSYGFAQNASFCAQVFSPQESRRFAALPGYRPAIFLPGYAGI
ncbi:hypothetical protein ACLECR_10895 [Lonsdalea quercina]|uniref:hypothetical protein n=1 Tax=Lonsdalea quercina TaxID=71657 RepID=UPI0039755B2A